jgi:hypothetical protein
LETYVPSSGKLVMVVLHEDPSVLNHIGKVLERNHDKELVVVQMEQTYDIMVRIPVALKTYPY